ncbi:hypothetical protein E2562_025843 [Oryza meyeriana var. granulata]|uniref:DOG1 domain-containing protein n=1 Tax=Oryza meyeriana var. granulata TaxID=110450 RepID=A0A6G1E2K3_9ORYZ|nr:hypothetical protein E2562_025843 [Oryza meyeriana var. granulata]
MPILPGQETAAIYVGPRRDSGAAGTGMEHGAGEMVAFYAAWVGREEQIVANLTDALRAPRRRDVLAPLVDAAVDHVSEYYEHKARLADRDVVAALDPHWLNPLERTFLWAWGWKPALVFRFADGDVVAGGSHAHQQRRALERLRAATVEAEREVDREVVALQESLAGPRVLAALCRQHPRNGEADEAVAAVGRSLRVLLAAADALRERTVRDIVGTLAPDQAGAFLAAMMRFHLGVHRAGRNWGSGNGGRRGL